MGSAETEGGDADARGEGPSVVHRHSDAADAGAFAHDDERSGVRAGGEAAPRGHCHLRQEGAAARCRRM